MMRKTRMIAGGLLLLMLLPLLAGCSRLRYDAKLYSYANEWIDEDFLDENRVRGASYLTQTTWYGEPEWIRDKDAPSTRTFIITSEEEYAEIFTNSPPDINFEKQMVILHVVADMSPRKYYMRGMGLDDGVLTVKVRLAFNYGKDDAVMSYPRCFMLVMKKAEITEVLFEEVRW